MSFRSTLCVLLRGMSARGAERDSVRGFLNPTWDEGSLCWRGSGQRGSAERSCSYHFKVCRVCLNVAVYQSSRPTRRCSGRASRHEIGAILEYHFVQTFIQFVTARR